MPSAVTPVLVTRDVERLVAFYRDLFDAEPTMRVPEDGRSSIRVCGSVTPISGWWPTRTHPGRRRRSAF